MLLLQLFISNHLALTTTLPVRYYSKINDWMLSCNKNILLYNKTQWTTQRSENCLCATRSNMFLVCLNKSNAITTVTQWVYMNVKWNQLFNNNIGVCLLVLSNCNETFFSEYVSVVQAGCYFFVISGVVVSEGDVKLWKRGRSDIWLGCHWCKRPYVQTKRDKLCRESHKYLIFYSCREWFKKRIFVSIQPKILPERYPNWWE